MCLHCTVLQHAAVKKKGCHPDTTTDEACFLGMLSDSCVKDERLILLVIALTVIANASRIGLATHSHNSASIAANPSWLATFRRGGGRGLPSLAETTLRVEVLFSCSMIKLLRASSADDDSSTTER
jgi:hypothetical protein